MSEAARLAPQASRRTLAPPAWTRSGESLSNVMARGNGTREMISLIRAGSIDGWDKLIAAVEEALRLGISDAAAVPHLLRMPDPEQRHQYAVALA